MRLIVQQMHLQQQLLFLVGGLEYITGTVRLNGWLTVGCCNRVGSPFSDLNEPRGTKGRVVVVGGGGASMSTTG